MALLATTDTPSRIDSDLYVLGASFVKEAGIPEPAYSLAGMLYLSTSGYALLGVPNALVRGVYDSMDEAGVELPPSGSDGRLNAHITVMTPDEIKTLGGPDRLTERGKSFHYRIGGLVSVAPAGWPEMSKAFLLRIHSPELQELRRSYGLSSLPAEGKHDFHITVAVKRRGVLGRNETSKGAA